MVLNIGIPHTIYTHYFGFTVPEQALGAFIYLRYQPVFKMVSGGVCIFRGMQNYKWHDIAHLNFVNTMPYPEVIDGAIESANGLRIEFPEPDRWRESAINTPIVSSILPRLL